MLESYCTRKVSCTSTLYVVTIIYVKEVCCTDLRIHADKPTAHCGPSDLYMRSMIITISIATLKICLSLSL